MRGLTIAVLAPVLLLASCAGRGQSPGTPELTGLDPKLSTFAYMEEGSLVSFIVDTKATRYHRNDAYIPLEIALANRDLDLLTLSRESFTLVDAQGTRHAVASPRELIENYQFLDNDQRTLAELPGIVFNKFSTFTRYQSRFSPLRSGPVVPGESTLVQDRVNVPKFGYIIDFLYFPRPPDAVLDDRFELFLDTPQLDEPVFVKFQVRWVGRARTRGSNARSASRVSDTTVTAMSSPGTVAIHGAVASRSRPSAMMVPQDASGAGTPTPRNDSEASSSRL